MRVVFRNHGLVLLTKVWYFHSCDRALGRWSACLRFMCPVVMHSKWSWCTRPENSTKKHSSEQNTVTRLCSSSNGILLMGVFWCFLMSDTPIPVHVIKQKAWLNWPGLRFCNALPSSKWGSAHNDVKGLWMNTNLWNKRTMEHWFQAHKIFLLGNHACMVFKCCCITVEFKSQPLQYTTKQYRWDIHELPVLLLKQHYYMLKCVLQRIK